MRSTVSYNGTVDWLSHHLRRLCNRGLAKRIQSQDDGRATDAVLTEKGMSAVVAAKPGHAVRTLFFGALPDELLSPFTEALEHIEASLNLDSSLPPFPPECAPGGPA
jgi:DNA-binding MarR family transcriptional regulator